MVKHKESRRTTEETVKQTPAQANEPEKIYDRFLHRGKPQIYGDIVKLVMQNLFKRNTIGIQSLHTNIMSRTILHN